MVHQSNHYEAIRRIVIITEVHMKKQIVGNLVKFTFEGDVPPLTFDCTKMSGANRAYAIPFAMCHRLGDAAALSRTMPDGSVRVITEAMRREAVAEIAAHYEGGSEAWEMRTTRAPARNPVWEAIAAKRGVEYDVVAAEKVAADLAELEGMA